MVNAHDPTDSTTFPNTILYINALITAISTIYEREIDTHSSSTLYDSATTTSEALTIMTNNYASTTAWHYTDPNSGQVPDLHHGIFYKSIGGGLANLFSSCDSNGVCTKWGVQCNPNSGFGLSGGVQGSISDIDSIPTMFWDLIVVAHELGHNFGSGHTHDSTAYTPLIDECGLGTCTSLVDSSTVGAGDATIMSYCHLCSGGTNNIGSTFGGIWNQDDRTNVNNWNDTDTGWGQDPRRVSHHMYIHIASLGTCVAPYITGTFCHTPSLLRKEVYTDIKSSNSLAASEQSCTVDSDCRDGISCTTDICNSGSCTNTMNNNCCGNFICEAGESSCSDCGPFKLDSGRCTSGCSIPYTFMIDVQAITDIRISSLTIVLYSGTSNVKVYTATGGYADKYTSSSSWTEIFTSSYSSSDTWVEIKMDFTEIAVSSGTTQSFYIYATGKIIASPMSSNDPLAIDDNLRILTLAKGGVTEFSAVYSNEFSFPGAVQYSLQVPTTSSPSHSPSQSPSSSPSKSPSLRPSRLPSSSPTKSPTAPSRSPSKSPTKSPSTSPSKSRINPSTSPSTSPTKSPSSSPTTSPMNPSTSPTTTPTKSPSTSPTSASPSKSPSVSPSASPISSAPTSMSPSKSPSASPSKSPSTSPVNSPSAKPSLSLAPSDAPSITVSQQPSESSSPTVIVTTPPTKAPTTQAPVASPHKYYPKWASYTCINDGNEEDCCKNYYAYDL
ncbi:hypothetical protein ACHAWO_007147 [Cyclotella atomus]|uniref:Peptidase M12B domain-containing protein n=1 Tax=Cyclotella atomus TaxID=382360 RepID=A0ABD3PRG4_9STRA